MSAAAREPNIGAYRLMVEVPVRFRDTDAMGHVNNAVYLTYLELARERYWREVFGLVDYSKIDLILARVEIDFRSPSRSGETIVVGIRASTIGTRSFEFTCEAWEMQTRRLVLEARTTQVMYDYEAGRTKPMSEEARKTILAFEAPGTVLVR
jgi:acyl-CoA thioester hydrolase